MACFLPLLLAFSLFCCGRKLNFQVIFKFSPSVTEQVSGWIHLNPDLYYPYFLRLLWSCRTQPDSLRETSGHFEAMFWHPVIYDVPIVKSGCTPKVYLEDHMVPSGIYQELVAGKASALNSALALWPLQCTNAQRFLITFILTLWGLNENSISISSGAGDLCFDNKVFLLYRHT